MRRGEYECYKCDVDEKKLNRWRGTEKLYEDRRKWKVKSKATRRRSSEKEWRWTKQEIPKLATSIY